MAYRILLRRDTLINWNYNEPVLLSGEAGFVTDTGRLKIGDGQSNWSALPYLNTGLSELNQDIIPALDRTYNIGSASLRWKDGYFGTVYTDSATIYIGTAQISQAPNDGIQASAYTIEDPNGATGVQLIFNNGTLAVIDSNGMTAAFGGSGGSSIFDTGTGNQSTLRIGNNSLAGGGYSTVSGGINNTASCNYATVSGGYTNTASGYISTVSGGEVNVASYYASTVSGGRYNAASCDYSTVSGGCANTASGYISTVSGDHLLGGGLGHNLLGLNFLGGGVVG